jgi:hypothetical protein
MKPLNINKESCSPVSSNCVIWQGPDIECIGLCKGATVTEVVYELATQLCGVLETLDVSKYDLTCLNITTCPPETFTELLTLLIERLCEVIATPCPPCEDGANGNYIVTAYEPAGENCEFGGVSITTYDGTTNLPIVGSVVYVCNGEDGNDGTPGQTGGPGTPGQRGDRGLNGNYVVQTEEPSGVNCECGGIKFEVKDGLTDAVLSTDYLCEPCEIPSNCEISFDEEGAHIVETAWLDLEGFDHQTGANRKPKVKRIGNQLHFKGNVFIPLSATDGGTVITNSANSSYVNQPYNHVFRGVGGCKINTDGAILFNYDGTGSNPTNNSSGARSVLPAGLDLCGKSIDDTYEKQYIASRQISTSSTTNGTSLSSVFQIFINSSGHLIVQTLKDIENNTVDGGSNVGGSALRYITSNVRAGERVPVFNNSGSQLHTFDDTVNSSVVVNILEQGSGYTNGTYSNVNIESVTSSGMLATIIISGNKVTSFVITDQGTGYLSGDGLIFSTTNAAGILAGTGFLGSQTTTNTVDNIETALRSATTYTFSCDAGQPEQIGGFVFKLDGLIAYLD